MHEIHIYIIGHYNSSVGIIDLISHTTYVVCVNFIHKWRDVQFKVDCERQIFWETFHDRVFARNLLRGNRRGNTFRISFWCLAWNSNPGFSSNKPTHGDSKSPQVNTIYFIRKMKIGNTPDYLTEQLRYVDEVQPYSLRNAMDFIQQSNTTAKQKSLLHKGLNLRNYL